MPVQLLTLMEQEIRIKIADIDSVKNLLESKGAELLSFKEQEDMYFGNKDIYKKLGRSFMLRIRNSGGEYELAFKGATGKDGIYEEHQIKVNKDYADELKIIIERSGFEHIITVNKKRHSYRYMKAEIELDQIDGLGDFVEIEIISDEAKDEELKSITADLGFDKNEIIRKGYVTMLLAKNNSPYSKYING